MINKSGLKPLGRAVLVRMVELDAIKAQLIKIPDHVRVNSATVEQRCEVVAVGGSCWEDEKEPRAKPGDKVIITKYAGYVAIGPKDKQIYRFVNDRDIFGSVEEVANG